MALLLLLAAVAPFILAWIIVREHRLSWPRGELTAVVGLTALTLILVKGFIFKPGEPTGQISLSYGYFLALIGLDPHPRRRVRALHRDRRSRAEPPGPMSGAERGQVPDRNVALELVRVTKAAALAAARLIGRGDKEEADQAAVDGMRHQLRSIAMDGVVVIGEGEKDEAPMLYNGEEIGDGTPPPVDIAVDPLEGTRLTALGMPNALAVIALSERGTMFDPGPCVYMEKIAGGPEVADLLDLDRP